MKFSKWLPNLHVILSWHSSWKQDVIGCVLLSTASVTDFYPSKAAVLTFFRINLKAAADIPTIMVFVYLFNDHMWTRPKDWTDVLVCHCGHFVICLVSLVQHDFGFSFHADLISGRPKKWIHTLKILHGLWIQLILLSEKVSLHACILSISLFVRKKDCLNSSLTRPIN